jgi:hypothetical protein
MKKKIISCVLVSFLLFSVGCYSTQTITREQFQATTKEELNAKCEQLDVAVFTKDSLEYKFSKGNYRIQRDTLTGFGVQTIGGTDKRFQGSISLADITSLKTEGFSLSKTIIAASLPFAAFGVFVLIMALQLSGR